MGGGDPFGFDRVIDRRGSDSLKWSRYAASAQPDVLPLWVADMDFAAPPAVIAALQRRVAHGVFGYAEPSPALTAALLGHLDRSYGWRIAADWLVWLPGLVSGLNVACRAVDGGVLTATPVYPPFMSAPRFSGRALATVPLLQDDGRWRWDWPAMAAALTPDTRLLLLCHPHNPVGRAWDDGELAALADFCRRHELIVCSDEIHCDLILDARRHRPFAMLGDDLAARSITLMAPSKTFNIPGLGCAFAVIPDAGLRRAFTRAMAGIVPHVNVLGLAACEAALGDSADWHAALLAVLRRNRDRVEAAVATLPPLRMTHVEATYLAWIDVRGLSLLHPQRHLEMHGLGLSDGADFGAPGWLRLNFGCPLATLEEALRRLAAGVAAA
ncbi:MAG: putative C-S lyase [Rhodocyclales bacterium]|nr:putative C-S lyase [Rhodocyclales bacterium]